jgi:hypothetical protein
MAFRDTNDPDLDELLTPDHDRNRIRDRALPNSEKRLIGMWPNPCFVRGLSWMNTHAEATNCGPQRMIFRIDHVPAKRKKRAEKGSARRV